MWPPSSPNLNPAGFSAKGILEKKTCGKSHRGVKFLKGSFVKAWDEIPKKMLRHELSSKTKEITLKNGLLIAEEFNRDEF